MPWVYTKHEDDSCILNIGPRWRWMVSLMQWQIHSYEENSTARLPGTEPQASSLQPLTLQDELSWLFHINPTMNTERPQILMAPQLTDHDWFTINEMLWHHNLSQQSNTKWNVNSFLLWKQTTITLLSSKSNVFRYRDVHLSQPSGIFKCRVNRRWYYENYTKFRRTTNAYRMRPLNLNASISFVSPDDGRRNDIPLWLRVWMLAAEVLWCESKMKF